MLQNEDCGQMSAWYIFSALGFYPVNPVSGEYIVGRSVPTIFVLQNPVNILPLRSPFFDQVTLTLPTASRPLSISARGASSGKPYIASVTIDGVPLSVPVIRHEQIKDGAEVVFEMSATPASWGSETLVRLPHLLRVQ